MNSSFLCSSAASERRIIRVEKEGRTRCSVLHLSTQPNIFLVSDTCENSLCGSYFSWPLYSLHSSLSSMYPHNRSSTRFGATRIATPNPHWNRTKCVDRCSWILTVMPCMRICWTQSPRWTSRSRPCEKRGGPKAAQDLPEAETQQQSCYFRSTNLSWTNPSSATYFNLKCKHLDHMTLLPVMIMWSISLFPQFINKCEDNTAMPRWSLMSVQNAEKMNAPGRLQ